MKEMMYIPFYLLYVVEWLIKLFCKGSAYRNISFEREAYDNPVSYKHLRAHETGRNIVCRLLLEKKK